MTPINIYSNWSAWAQPAGNTDTYAPGYAASQDHTVNGAAMILVVLNSLGEVDNITYGGTSPAQTGGIESGGGPAFLLFDLVANKPASGALVGFTGLGGMSMWSAITIGGTTPSQTLCDTAPAASNVDPASLNFAGLNQPGYLIVTAANVNVAAGPTVVSSDSAALYTSLSPNPYGNGQVLVAWQFPTTAPTIAFHTGDGSDVFNANSAVFYPGVSVTAYGKFRGHNAFRPVSLCNVGSINPKIYAPGQNTTIKSQS